MEADREASSASTLDPFTKSPQPQPLGPLTGGQNIEIGPAESRRAINGAETVSAVELTVAVISWVVGVSWPYKYSLDPRLCTKEKYAAWNISK